MAQKDLVKDMSAIRKKGALNWAYKRVNADGTDLETPDTWHDGVFRKEHDYNFDTPFDEEALEDNSQATPEYGITKFDVTLKSAQDDADLEMFLITETEPNFFAIIMERGPNSLAKDKVSFIPICKIAKSYQSKSGDRKPDIKIKGIVNASAITPSSVPTWAGTAAQYAVPAKQYYISIAKSST